LNTLRHPAVNTLVIGDLIVNGLVDLHCPGVENGGSLVVFGNVSCNILASDIEPWQFLERIEAGRSIFRRAPFCKFCEFG
jgi:hypothetical protein